MGSTFGYCSPVEVPKTGWDVDKDGADMRKLMNALAADSHTCQPTDITPSDAPEGQWQDGLPRDGSEKEFTFMELVERARRAGAFESLIGADGDQAELDRKLKTTFSRILTRYNGRFIGDYVFLAKGHGHSRRYVIRNNSLNSMTPPELR